MTRAPLLVVLALAALTRPVLTQDRGTPPFAPDEILVRFRAGVPATEVASRAATLNVRVARRYTAVDDLYLLKLDAGARLDETLAELSRRADVLYAEPNFVVRIAATPNDPSFGSLWGLHNTGQSGGTAGADIDAPAAWDITTGSAGVVVVVIDTGIDYTHQDLAANMFRNESDCNTDGVDNEGNGFIDDCYGIDTHNDDADPMDDNAHGTHVAGSIGAVGNNGVGVAGVNWNVRLMACKFLDEDGSGFTSNAVDCLEYVAMMRDRGVNVVVTNNSWSGGSFSQSLYDAINDQRAHGILFAAAAGNSALDNDTTDVYPANYYLPNVIAVASTTRTGARSSFSDFGRQTVHLGAPGSDILSTTPGNNYASFDGTSMATPHVAGAAALLKAHNSGLDWRAIRNLILTGSDVTAATSAITVSGRRLNAHGALTCTNSVVASRLQPVREIVISNAGQTVPLSSLHINCAQPNGSVQVSTPGGSITLLDNGSGGDQVADDGVYSGTYTVSSSAKQQLTFPGGDVVEIRVLRGYQTPTDPGFAYETFTGTKIDTNFTAAVITSPFAIRFGGSSFTQLSVSEEGFIDPGNVPEDPLSFLNQPLPFAPAGARLAPFWTNLAMDFFPLASTRHVFWAVLGSAPQRRLVVEWRDALPCFQIFDGVTFQVIFYEGSSNVRFNYGDTTVTPTCTVANIPTTRGGLATVGIQTGPTVAVQRAYSPAANFGTGPLLNDNMSLLFTITPGFTDSSLSGLAIKALHFTELRNRIDELRAARGLAAFSWTALAPGTRIDAAHVEQLRAALAEAYTAAALPPPVYADPTLTAGATPIKAVHIDELRSAVLALEEQP